MDRIARIQSLGRQRGRVIECLGGNSRLVRGAYFDPAADIDMRIGPMSRGCRPASSRSTWRCSPQAGSSPGI
jgi:hypothetical protein